MTRLAYPRRRFLETAVVASALMPGGIGGLIGEVLAQGGSKQGVQRLRGDVKVNGQPAKPGTLVLAGDTVTTGANSYVTFVVGEDAFLARGNTQLQLGGVKALIDLARVVTGKLLSVYQRGRQHRIEGSTATIGLRGTGAYIEVIPERTYFCLCYGVADIVPTAAPDSGETVRTRHHESPRYIYAMGAPKIMEPAPVINHRDEELILLESLVGRVPAFLQNRVDEFGTDY